MDVAVQRRLPARADRWLGGLTGPTDRGRGLAQLRPAPASQACGSASARRRVAACCAFNPVPYHSRGVQAGVHGRRLGGERTAECHHSFPTGHSSECARPAPRSAVSVSALYHHLPPIPQLRPSGTWPLWIDFHKAVTAFFRPIRALPAALGLGLPISGFFPPDFLRARHINVVWQFFGVHRPWHPAGRWENSTHPPTPIRDDCYDYLAFGRNRICLTGHRAKG